MHIQYHKSINFTLFSNTVQCLSSQKSPNKLDQMVPGLYNELKNKIIQYTQLIANTCYGKNR